MIYFNVSEKSYPLLQPQSSQRETFHYQVPSQQFHLQQSAIEWNPQSTWWTSQRHLNWDLMRSINSAFPTSSNVTFRRESGLFTWSRISKPSFCGQCLRTCRYCIYTNLFRPSSLRGNERLNLVRILPTHHIVVARISPPRWAQL